MQDNGSLRLFRRGPAAEVRLVILVLAALALLITDARWQTLEPLRRAVSVGIYPFQRLVLAPRDAVSHVQYWIDGAAIARTEKEALQRQRIELAQIATHAAQLSTENEQLRRLLNVAGTVTQPSVAVEVLYEPANRYTRHLVFNKGESSGIRPGMPIIDEGGIVGQVVRVTPYTAEAAMLTDEAVSIPVQVMRNGLRLIAFGAGASGKVEVRYLTEDVDLEEGDVLITSGVGGVFPAGLSVASVDRIDHDTASGFAVGVATPLSHPERYRHFLVLLVENTFGAPGDAEGGVQ
ncbi:rod shape-determining protein MreC [Paracandidimonas soli]|uniref:Cell shape-determining protein MreC n=1 Tax=Paracandidimonas soli TaxID=1917182 RepID=A0A4R3V4X7_9BURK|nr:rod shape-determining protein MreC [Paracandidimonas soli]TCU98358.1 rod shape-determining protein MreC [Paracandidimonas soli]